MTDKPNKKPRRNESRRGAVTPIISDKPNTLREKLLEILEHQWYAARKSGEKKMLSSLISEPIISDATVNKIIATIYSSLKLPKGKKPSDPKYHNKTHKPEPEPPHECNDEECEHYVVMPPKYRTILKTYNDGYNQALRDVKDKLMEVLK